jgi:flagellar L-ring protein precursor FlgH
MRNTDYRIQNTELRTQSTEYGLQNTDRRKDYVQGKWRTCMRFVVLAVVSGLWIISVTGCASTSAKLPLPPPKYVYNMDVPRHTGSTNSLWSDTSNIIEDTKARYVNDLVTIKIVESLSGSGNADTDTSRDSSADYDMTNFFGMNTDFNIQNVKILKDFYKGANIFQPKLVGSGKSDFKGEGDTNRAGTLNATITAKVVEALPNGNLLLEARKELTINEENQILVLTGVVRPLDIDADNIVLSDKLADARIYYVGDGVINDKQKPGWMVRVFDNIWPF